MNLSSPPNKDTFISTGWYKKENANGVYYSPFTSGGIKYHTPGKTGVNPTPEEWAAFLGTPKYKDAITVESGGYAFTYEMPTEKEMTELPGGVYMYAKPSGEVPERLTPMTIRNDSYIDVSGITKEVYEDIQNFLDNEALYRENGIIYKLGFLLYGPPGNGKTTILRQLLHNRFPDNSVTIYLYSLPSTSFLAKLAETLPNRLKVFVFEELVTVVNDMPLHKVLNFLDGEHSIDNSIVFATTNHPEKLPANLVDRPSRFDKRYKIGNPDKENRKKILEFYLHREVTAEEVAITKDLSVAGLKELTLLTRMKKIDCKEAVRRLQTFSELVKKDFGEYKKMGFNQGDEFE